MCDRPCIWHRTIRLHGTLFGVQSSCIDNMLHFVLSIIMATTKAKASLMERCCDAVNRPGVDSLQMICDALNSSGAPWVAELRRLLAIWLESGPNLEMMLKADSTLERQLKEDFRALWLPTTSGRSHMFFSPHGDPHDPNSESRGFFMMITLSPEWQKFGGPCPRCAKYFMRQTAKPSKYCSHRCASQETASKRTTEVRKERHEGKLLAAKEAIARWEKHSTTGRRSKGWKEFVAQYDPTVEITTRFLTRAVNNGELQPPTIEERKK
jgi:hypothetical protein